MINYNWIKQTDSGYDLWVSDDFIATLWDHEKAVALKERLDAIKSIEEQNVIICEIANDASIPDICLGPKILDTRIYLREWSQLYT